MGGATPNYDYYRMKPMKNNPCKDCRPPKRTGDCHGTCPDYIIAKAFHEAERAEERKKAEPGLYSSDIARKNAAHAQKRKRRFSGYNFPL